MNLNTSLKKIIRYVIKNKQKLSIIIAISGGQDSLYLIKLINDYLLKNRKYITVHYLYIDHQWTSKSLKHVKHLINYFTYYKYRLFIYQINNIPLSENYARQYRYKIIVQHSIKYKCQIIITGHNKTDKIETFLFNLLRGTGLNGATSLNIKTQLNPKLHIIRPLMSFNRYDLSWLCRKYYLPIWSDVTNYHYEIKRNRIRYELTQYLQNYFSSNLEKQILDFIQCISEDNEYIKQNTILLYYKSRHSKYIALYYTKIIKQHKALVKRMIQLWFYHNFTHIIPKTKLIKLIHIIYDHQIKYIKIPVHYLYINKYKNWLYISL
uniref:tRNA(Ile)-lysidine synthase n=1 Tax=Crouania attenuata TaxID=42002 RepID=A0A4D6WS89_9FLOR|nr:tRNA Ile-lysidine synthetase [Crouania attenuata]